MVFIVLTGALKLLKHCLNYLYYFQRPQRSFRCLLIGITWPSKQQYAGWKNIILLLWYNHRTLGWQRQIQQIFENCTETLITNSFSNIVLEQW